MTSKGSQLQSLSLPPFPFKRILRQSVRFGYGDGRGEAFRKKFKRLLDSLSSKKRLLVDENNGVCLSASAKQVDDNAA